MTDINISLMQSSERHECARVLSVAMLDAKLHMAVFQGSGELERQILEEMFDGLFIGLPGIIFLAKENEQIIGVMRMKSCDGCQPVASPGEPEDENELSWRQSVWHAEWAQHEPKSQHWHLGPIGVLPSHQGQGIGSLLMARFCREVDACQADAYLETDVDKNVRFYKKFGFQVVSESDIFDVKNRYMLRPYQR